MAPSSLHARRLAGQGTEFAAAEEEFDSEVAQPVIGGLWSIAFREKFPNERDFAEFLGTLPRLNGRCDEELVGDCLRDRPPRPDEMANVDSPLKMRTKRFHFTVKRAGISSLTQSRYESLLFREQKFGATGNLAGVDKKRGEIRLREVSMRAVLLFSCVLPLWLALVGDHCQGDPGGRGTAKQVAEAELAKWAGRWMGPGGETLTISGNRFASAAPGDGSFRGTIRIVEVGPDAARADLRIEEDGEEMMVVLAIFRLAGGTLHYCGNDPGQPRPTEFKSEGTKHYVLWQRPKK